MIYLNKIEAHRKHRIHGKKMKIKLLCPSVFSVGSF